MQNPRNSGLYLVADCHTSYWPGFGGGYKFDGSFIEFSKRLVDTMHSWYTDDDDAFPDHEMASVINSVLFYDSIVAIEKLKRGAPMSLVSQNGEITRSRKALDARNRISVFK